jgi:glucosamine-6-phosphate deaminase
MEIVVAENYEDLSRRAARWLRDVLTGINNPHVILPTGNTPLGLYRNLRADPDGEFLGNARFIQLDEYQGISLDDPRSLAGWLRSAFLQPLSIPETALLFFDSSVDDPDREAARVEAAVSQTGVDACVLGLGPNGHLGFNEPGSDFKSQTRVVTLSKESIKSNAVYWGDENQVPRHAFTLGLGTLAAAKHTLLLVSGAHKAGILAATLEGPMSPDIPATCLRDFRNVTVIADRNALLNGHY